MPRQTPASPSRPAPRTASRLLRHFLPAASLVVAAIATSPRALAADPAGAITGAGSTAAAPVYRVWSDEYVKTGGAPLTYAGVGSTAGMQAIIGGKVDFGASDFIASAADRKAHDLVMFPTVVTGVVPVVNLPKGAPQPLRLTGDVLARIFLGEITSWDAPQIQALNPQGHLPALPIRVIARAEGSGTTYHFSDYLSRVSPTWKARHGVAPKFDWPKSVTLAQGNGGVSEAVQATAGAIAYVDYNYVLDEHLTGVSMRNAAGAFVTADVQGFRSAVTHSAWYDTGDFSPELNDLPGRDTWPITMGTYIALPRVAAHRASAERALRFIVWSYLHGDTLAARAKFVPLPVKVQANAYAEIARVVDATGAPIGLGLMNSLVR